MNVRQIPLGSTGVRVSEMIFGGAPAELFDDLAAEHLMPSAVDRP